MKLLIWVVSGIWVAAVSFWLVTVTEANPISVAVFVVIDIAATVGALWMMEVVVREEKQPCRMIWLVILPFSFLWYYFERVRRWREPARPLIGQNRKYEDGPQSEKAGYYACSDVWTAREGRPIEKLYGDNPDGTDPAGTPVRPSNLKVTKRP